LFLFFLFLNEEAYSHGRLQTRVARPNSFILAKVNGSNIHFSTHFQKILDVAQKCMDRPKKSIKVKDY
jgi:hypothetical protein